MKIRVQCIFDEHCNELPKFQEHVLEATNVQRVWQVYNDGDRALLEAAEVVFRGEVVVVSRLVQWNDTDANEPDGPWDIEYCAWFASPSRSCNFQAA